MDFKTRRAIAQTLLHAAAVLEAELPKDRWTRLTVSDLKNDPALAEELFLLVQEAYAPIGGHAKIKSPADLMKEATFFDAVNIDEDDDADAVLLVKQKPAGEKGTGMGHDGTKPAKDAAIKKHAKDLNRPGHYIEVSGAIAHILLTKFSVPVVTDEAIVRRVLNKDLTWIGQRPDGKYPQAAGWYERAIGSDKHMKILLGEPKKV
jgi:hypothetical protein